MLTVFLISVIVILLVCLGFAGFYMVRFARIVMSIEDSLNGGLETFENTEKSLENLLKMQLFFESKEVQAAVRSALDDVTLSKMAVTSVIRDFTRLSKQKYEMVTVDDDDESEYEEEPPRTQRVG